MLVLASCTSIDVNTGDSLKNELRTEAQSSSFIDQCRGAGGSIEVAADIFCMLDFNKDGQVDSSEYCGYSDFIAGGCTLFID